MIGHEENEFEEKLKRKKKEAGGKYTVSANVCC